MDVSLFQTCMGGPKGVRIYREVPLYYNHADLHVLTVKNLDALSSADLRFLVLRLFLRDEDLGESSLPCEFICVRERKNYV